MPAQIVGVHLAERLWDKCLVDRLATTLDCGHESAQANRVAETGGGGHLESDRGLARHHHHPGRCGSQDQTPTALGEIPDELLGQSSAPGDPHDVDFMITHLVEQTCGKARHVG
jgi:hypothetical protein